MGREARAQLEAMQRRTRELEEALATEHSEGFLARRAVLQREVDELTAREAALLPTFRRASEDAAGAEQALRDARVRLRGDEAQRRLGVVALLLVLLGGVGSCYGLALLWQLRLPLVGLLGLSAVP
ncbi:MAG: hypothetical protein AB1938_27435, partial [Myxococcota bacterium]